MGYRIVLATRVLAAAVIRNAAIGTLLFAIVATAWADDTRVSGSFGGSLPEGGSFQGTFTCFGAPICTGIYNMKKKRPECSNEATYSDSFVMTGVDLTHTGALSGTVTLIGKLSLSSVLSGVCTFTRDPNALLTLPYNGTWDGRLGTFIGSATDDQGRTFPVPGNFTSNVTIVPPVFPMMVTGSITPTLSDVAAQIQYRPQDVGTTGSVFVFALAPQSLVKEALTGKEAKDGPAPCVLAQLNSSGQLISSSASTLVPYTSGILSAQGQAVTILNNVSTPQVAGATFFVGYGPNATTMLNTGINRSAVSVPGPEQCPNSIATAPGALSGLWWNENESGWGISFTQRRNIVFAAWYTYDSAGNPKWYVASNCAMPSGVTGTSGACNGSLYEVRGPTFFGSPFNSSAVSVSTAGTLQVNFQNANNASMTYTAGGQTRTVAITRQVFQAGTTAPQIDYTDLWWNTNESGWGMALTHQFGVMFLAWYVYDSTGRPVWYVASNCAVSGNSCSGTLYSTTGPAFGPTFNPLQIQVFTAGTVSLAFTDANNGTLSYTVNGVSSTKAITRQLF